MHTCLYVSSDWLTLLTTIERGDQRVVVPDWVTIRFHRTYISWSNIESRMLNHARRLTLCASV